MKLNLKMCLAAVVIVVTIIVATSVVRPATYSGLGLNFPIGNGAVTITNASKDSLPVQLVGTGYSTFALNSKTEGVGGTSVKQTVGTTISQLLEFSQPSGVTTFTITKGANIKYIAPAETRLQASVLPMTDTDTRNIGFVAIGIILVALYYISAQTEHTYARKLLHRELPIPIVVAPAVVDNTNVGRDGRMYSNYGTKD